MRDAESLAAKEHQSCPGRNHFVAELSRTCFEKSLSYQLLHFAFDDQSDGILVLLKKKTQALSLPPFLPVYKAIGYICSFLSSKKKEKKKDRERVFQQRKDSSVLE